MKHKKFIHIFFPAELRPGDIEIITEPTTTEPGQARLQAATIGDPQQGTISHPLFSASLAKIGYIANEGIEDITDFEDFYWLVEEQNNH